LRHFEIYPAKSEGLYQCGKEGQSNNVIEITAIATISIFQKQIRWFYNHLEGSSSY